MKEGLGHIIAVIDRSGSMDICKKENIEGFNSFLLEQKRLGNAKFTLVLFDDQYQEICKQVDIQEVNPLNEQTYVPRGMTALLDAIGKTIVTEGEYLASLDESERPSNVSFVILTDGYENYSREYTREKVFDMIKHQTDKYNWNFVYLGANQDAIAVGQSLGIRTETSATYTTSNTRDAWHSLSGSVRAYRANSSLEDANISDATRSKLVQ